MARVSPTGHRLTRGRARLKEGSEAHLWVAVVRVGVDGVNIGELVCGRRSSGVHRNEAMKHGVKIWWVCSALGSALSAVVRSDACLHGRSRGGDMNGGEKLSALMATVVRRRGPAQGERGKGAGAHGESSRGNGEAGEGLELANPRRVRRRPEVEDDVGDVAAGLPAGCGSMERKRGSRRSL